MGTGHRLQLARSRRAAASKAAPLVGAGRDGERGIFLLVEGAQAHQVLAHALQLDAACLHQPLDRDFPLDALHYLIRESGQSLVLLSLVFRVPAKILSREFAIFYASRKY
jgi:hypothetical protein